MCKEETWVTHTCKNCECAFMDIDEVDAYVSAPDYKYCLDCVKNGFKNTREARENYRKIARFEEYIYKWQMICEQPKKDVDFVYNKCMELLEQYRIFNKPIRTRSIFNEAIEILGYYKEEENEENLATN